MTDFIPKAIDDADHISILMLTRGRPEKVVRAIGSLDRYATEKDKIDLWIYVDDDDDLSRELIESGWHKSVGFPIHWHIGSRPVTHGDAFNHLWRISTNAGLYFGFPDDYEITSPDWDIVMRDTFRDLPSDRIAAGYLPDPFMPDGGITVMVETAQWVNHVGHFIAPYFPYWFGDKWLQQIVEMVDRKYCVPVGLFPMDGKKGTTNRLWDLSFWTRFFHLLLAERVDSAKRIIDNISVGDSFVRGQAIDFMHDKIEKFEKEAEDEHPPGQLLEYQLAFSGESDDKSEIYLKALHQAEKHLEVMTPRIIDLKTQHVLWLQRKLLTQHAKN